MADKPTRGIPSKLAYLAGMQFSAIIIIIVEILKLNVLYTGVGLFLITFVFSLRQIADIVSGPTIDSEMWDDDL